jgi:hypothetical protein
MVIQQNPVLSHARRKTEFWLLLIETEYILGHLWEIRNMRFIDFALHYLTQFVLCLNSFDANYFYIQVEAGCYIQTSVILLLAIYIYIVCHCLYIKCYYWDWSPFNKKRAVFIASHTRKETIRSHIFPEKNYSKLLASLVKERLKSCPCVSDIFLSCTQN